ncbi:hypothetical protein CT676_40760 [Bradyrhizobium sp. MOS001]|nr:hypothetical protein CT676_40760 [Bradyrhizobium sp. MOS001]
MRPARPRRALAAIPLTVADLIERRFLECMVRVFLFRACATDARTPSPVRLHAACPPKERRR